MAAYVYHWLAFLVVFSGPSEAQQLRPPQSLAGRELCTYQLAIPVGGNCVTDGPAIQQKLEAMKQDIEHAKLQSLTETNALQDQIHLIENKESRVDSRLTELANDISAVQKAVTALANSMTQLTPTNTRNNGNGNGPNNEMLLQLVTTIRTQLTLAMDKLGNDISSLKNQQQQYMTQQSTDATEVRSQLKQQQKDIEMLTQKVSNLQSLATQVQQPDRTQSSQLSALMGEMQKDVSGIQSRIVVLEEKNKAILQTMNNHSLAISDAAGQLQFIANQDKVLQTKIDTTSAEVQTNLPRLQSQVQRIAESVSALDQQVKNIGITSMNTVTQHSLQIADLQTQVQLMSSRIAKLSNVNPPNQPTPYHYNPVDNPVPTPRPRPGR